MLFYMISRSGYIHLTEIISNNLLRKWLHNIY